MWFVDVVSFSKMYMVLGIPDVIANSYDTNVLPIGTTLTAQINFYM